MNIGLTTSFIIGGILMLAILSMNMSLSNSSTELTLTQVTREKASAIKEMINHDLLKIGYNRKSKTDPMLVAADSNLIRFRSNIDNSSDNSVELVSWEFTSTALSNTKNPNDYVLMRTVKDIETGTEKQFPIKLGVTKFNIKYLDEHGAPISEHMATPLSSSDLSNVNQLYITLVLESSEKVYQNTKGDGRYVKTIWEKRFSPSNLESN